MHGETVKEKKWAVWPSFPRKYYVDDKFKMGE